MADGYPQNESNHSMGIALVRNDFLKHFDLETSPFFLQPSDESSQFLVTHYCFFWGQLFLPHKKMGKLQIHYL